MELTILSILFSGVLGWTDSFTGLINAPCVDGLDTKSNAINSKSGWTSTVSSSPCSSSFIVSTEPNPLELIPNFIPDLNNSFYIIL